MSTIGQKCPHCDGTAIASTAIGDRTVTFMVCGFTTMYPNHRPPSCYELELARIDGRRLGALDYLRDRMSELGEQPADELLSNELASVTNVLCGGSPFTRSA